MEEPKRNDIQIGDIVECIAINISNNHDEEMYAKGLRKHPLVIGDKYEVVGVHYSSGYNWINVVGNGVAVSGTYMHQFIKINSKNMNNITSILKKITRKEPEKTFIKTGFLDENEGITDRGKDALIHILWEENKEALKKLADQIYEEENNK